MIEELPEIRRLILHLLKKEPSRTIREMAEALGVTYESVRQQVGQMERDGWIAGSAVRGGVRTVGRPINRYVLTTAGEHLFPKSYDQLADRLLTVVGDEFGAGVVDRMLAAITEDQVARWEPLLAGKGLHERMMILKDLYRADDAHMDVESVGKTLRLVERNCPYLNIAMRHSALCSTSVATLTRLLGVRVVRDERFQNGDRRCVFSVHADQPVDIASWRFEREPEPSPVPPATTTRPRRARRG